MKTYIQIGANVGADGFQELIEKLKERARVVLVEPNPNLIAELTSNYSSLMAKHDIIIHPYGIGLSDGEANLYLYEASGHSSLLNRPSNPIRNGSIKISIMTFKTFCDMFYITDIEYISVDTEGGDYEIVNTFALEAVDIKQLVFEKWAQDNDDKNNVFRTGQAFLHNKVFPKFKGYKLREIILDKMPSYEFTKI